MESHNQTHLFSLYAMHVIKSSWKANSSVVITDPDLLHRMVKVLRFQINDSLVLFDDLVQASVTVEQITKKNITVLVTQISGHSAIEPQVTFLLPLLKKEALEEAVYSLAEMGINKIQLVVTQKSRKNLHSAKEFARLQAIIIAACEQSKNYTLPKLIFEQPLFSVLNSASNATSKILFDPSGQSFFNLQSKFKSSLVLLCGPEAGLTLDEVDQATKHNFVLCALTSTTLRAVQAVTLGAGLARLQP
jgi:RsmE family RNA methyltransferase